MRAAPGGVAGLVENTGNCAQAMASQSLFSNCSESRLLPRVRLDMDPVSRQSIAKLNISNPFPLAAFVTQRVARALTDSPRVPTGSLLP